MRLCRPQAMYERLFCWIVGRINDIIEVRNYDARVHGKNTVIGVLDIYGFEIFQNNRFEWQQIFHLCKKTRQHLRLCVEYFTVCESVTFTLLAALNSSASTTVTRSCSSSSSSWCWSRSRKSISEKESPGNMYGGYFLVLLCFNLKSVCSVGCFSVFTKRLWLYLLCPFVVRSTTSTIRSSWIWWSSSIRASSPCWMKPAWMWAKSRMRFSCKDSTANWPNTPTTPVAR